MAALDRNYDSLSHQLSTPNLIAPQSKAFEKVFASQPLTYLLDPDGKHPNDAGIYLNACIFHAILFHESPIGLPPLYLPAAQAAFLQDVANQVVGSATVDAGPLADAGAAADAGASGGGTTSGVLFVDNFNRTLASGLGPRWSIQIGAWRTNDKANSDLDAPNQASVAGLSCRDCSVQARVVNFAATTAALDLRHGSSNARYDLVLLGSGHIQIRRHDGSTFTVLGDAADTGPPGGGTTSRVLFVDNFNRTLASDLGPIWSVQVGAWRTNDKANSDLDAPNQASVTGLSCRDCSVQARVLNFAATTAALDLRHGSSNARYDLALLSTGRIQIRRHNGGAFTVLGDVASGIVDLGNWATLALSATGAGPVQLTASVNGATKLKVTDTSAAAITGAGTAGIWTDLAGVWFDDFTVIGVGP